MGSGRRIRPTRRHLLAVTIGAVAVSGLLQGAAHAAVSAGLDRTLFLDLFASRNLLWRLWDFVAGMAGAALLFGGHLDFLRRRLWREALLGLSLSALAGLVLVPASSGIAVDDTARQFRLGVLTILPFLGIILALAAGATTLSPLLRAKPLVLLGEASFGLYIFHWLPYAWLTSASATGTAVTPERAWLAILATIGFSLLSLRFFETPFRTAWRAQPEGRTVLAGAIDRALPLAAALAFPLCLFIAVSTAATIVAYRHEYPVWDMMAVQWAWFFDTWFNFFIFKDNEHLPILVMPMFALDNLMGAQGDMLVAGIFGLSVVMGGIAARSVLKIWGKPDPGAAVAAVVTMALPLWLIHWDNFIWPKQLHMYLSLFWFVLAALLVARLDRRYGSGTVVTTRDAGMVGLLLAASLFSFGYGVAGWAAVLLVVITARWPFRAVAVLLAIFGVALALYVTFYNYRTFDYHGNPAIALLRPYELAAYVVHFLGTPIIRLLEQAMPAEVARWNGQAIALISLIAAVVLVVDPYVRRRRDPGTAGQTLFPVLLVLFALATAVIVGLARVRFGFSLVSRYGIVQICFWLGLIGLAAARFGSAPRLRAVCAAFGGVVVLVLMVRSQGAMIETVRKQNHEIRVATVAMMTGVHDRPQVEGHLFPDLNLVAAIDRRLREKSWSVYARPEAAWIGRSVATLFRPAEDGRCIGWLDQVDDRDGRLAAGSFAKGWSWDRIGGRTADWIVLADRNGTVRGLGRSGAARPDVTANVPEIHDPRSGWAGYAPDPPPLSGYTAYAVLGDRVTICRLSRLP